ncbi:MAG: WG repeat-containing protein, partial [Candidatus Riflebacteria bacterium]|nr:WG repeat-containing protein [Candidatus Riflebacteria bacterium]
IKNFIGTDEVDDDNLLEVIPNLIKVETFPSVDSERFALKLFYDNGECKKYVLPIKRENEKDEAVSYQNHVFTDKIWQSAKISDDCSPEIIGYSNRFPKIIFDNGFFLSSLLCYYEGSDYSEPELTDDIIYEDENCILKRIWKWNVNSVYEDSDGLWKKHNDYKITRTGLLKVLITGSAFNDFQSTSTFITMEGKRLNGLDFDYIDSFSEGYARVAKIGYGYGFIDVNLKFTIPMQFEYAENFVNGYAKIQQNNDWYLIDKNGNKIDKLAKSNNKKYQELAEYYEGMCRVSTLKLRQYDLAYHSDDASIAGIWGFVNENGEELIAPQYIYANDFEKGMAIVCKGKWTIDKKWDNDCNKGRYWTEMELWGAIDKDGNEVIPFIFDEVKYFNDYDEALIVHYGGWEKGKWGVIDRTGKWLAEPIFEDIDYDYFDGMFAFYKEDKWSDDDVPLGIYDIKQQKVLFEPQFLDVDFLEDGWFKVEVYDEKLGRKIEKIIDKNGKEKFYSNYSYIFDWNRNEGALEVIIRIREDNKE